MLTSPDGPFGPQWAGAAWEPEPQTGPDPIGLNTPVKGAKMAVTKLNLKLSSRAMSLNPASATPSEIVTLLQRIKTRRLSVHFDLKQVSP